MSSERSPRFQTFALMGVCLLHVQLAERVLAGAIEMVLDDPTLTVSKLMEQPERERKRTLGDFLMELKKRAKVEPRFKDKLWRFLRMRNIFVHNLSEAPGWNLSTEEGRKAATAFLVELVTLAIVVTGVFMSLVTISAREEFGEELIEGNLLMGQLEKSFGPIARKILAGKHRKPVLVHSKGAPRG